MSSAFPAPTSQFGTPLFKNRAGRVFLLIGLQTTLYFEHGLTVPTRRRIRDALDRYLALARPYLKWITSLEGQQWEEVNESRLAALRSQLEEAVDAPTWEIELHGAERPEEASEFGFGVYTEREPRGTLSYLRFSLPMKMPENAAGPFRQLTLEICRVLQPYHGYGGLAFLESGDLEIAYVAQPMVFALAQRFPGAEVDRPLTHLMHVGEGIKGVNWLTILGPRWVEAIGGVPKLRQSLGKRLALHDYGGGVLIEAGPAPQLGDRNQKLWVAIYPELARLLQPIRIREHGSFDNFGPNRFTKETSEEWLARFDRDPW